MRTLYHYTSLETTWGRYIRGTRRAVAGVEVVIAGWQDASGQVERHASLWATDVQLDVPKLRELAAVALDAANELDQLGTQGQEADQ